MQDTEIRQWLLTIARDLLQHRQDVYRAFEHQVEHAVAGVALIASIHHSIPHEHWVGERMGSFDSLDYIGRYLMGVLERWLRDNSHTWDDDHGARRNPWSWKARSNGGRDAIGNAPTRA
jgi:hypothetical protein